MVEKKRTINSSCHYMGSDENTSKKIGLLVCEMEKSIKDTKKLQVFFTCLHCNFG